MHVKLALDTRCYRWKDDSGLAFKAFGAAINQWFYRIWVVPCSLSNGDQHSVNPAAGFDAVQAANDKLKLFVEVLVEILDTVVMGCNGDALYSLLDKLSSHLGFILANIVLPEEELTVQIGNINSI